LLAQCLAGLPRHTDDLHPDIAVKLGGVVTDLLAVTIADRVGDGARRVVDARHRTLVLAIHSYIEQRLSDPDLSPSSIAAAHHMSVRSLQRVFQAQGSTVTEWIRNRRLDRCRHDLANPLLVGRSVSSIAAVWQFTSPAHFTRLFRVTYGLAPGEYRRHATSSRRRDLSRG
jgi:AraC-like DNA-binding protein